MTVLAPPPNTRVIGTLTPDGRVQADIAWFRYWAQGIYDRIGGSTGSSNAELQILIDALTVSVAALDAGLADVVADVSVITADVAAIAADVATIQGDLTALTARVAALELATMQTALQYDYIDATTSYRGEAVPGSLTSDPLWRVQRITITGDDLVIEWADGSSDFTQIWDDRLTLTYS